jgi:two-component system, OmpR family, phosphate regulon response regulator OmpR
MPTVLLVDDSPEIREFVTAFLNDEGFTVTTLDRVEAALLRLSLSLPDLLILDGRLPGMSGWECLSLLRTDKRTARLPVLMLTAALSDVQMGEQEPPDDCTSHLGKPFDLDDLLAMINGVLDTCNQEPVAV